MIPLLRVGSMTVIKDADMDYFQRRILHGKKATYFVRDGQAFIYVEDTKIEIVETGETGDVEPNPVLQERGHTRINLAKDVRYEGVLRCEIVNEQYYVFAFVEYSKTRAQKGNIVMLAVGDLLREGEE